ncbi:hypothetical protein Halru_1645 [Halovivax ruber XH-70]|uniref:Uncharacterized protein n=1 Tax=Halovivax ruber (strain DSM 18193 / JCM 13892 / XH-70) TaxID=797302 RepID=L0IE66_HALRX|nr:hypothetical protein [Halovivax ruber]AGB16252.1 hypothetical protein Halru_1645 [Halovivax ruber XH-70]
MTQSPDTSSPAPSVTRATLQSYLIALVGVIFVVGNAGAAFEDGYLSSSTAGIVLGLLATGAAVVTALQPERIHRGEEPAPTHQYVLAAIATAATIAVLLS